MSIESFPTFENANKPVDVSERFLDSDQSGELKKYLKQLGSAQVNVNIDLTTMNASQQELKILLRKCKAFLEAEKPVGQERSVVIRATEEQYRLDVNVFESGARWERV